MASTDWAIETTNLRKSFGGVRAVDGLDLTVRAGGIYGLLGPNGAGKTTTIRILATLTRPDSGSAYVMGRNVVSDADAVRSRVSLTGQFASLDLDLTGRENLVLVARLLGHSWRAATQRADDLLEAFGLSEAAGRAVRQYSGGMRRRIDIAAGIVVRPAVVFLDEPTTGLDPHSRNQVWDVVRALAAAGTTVLLTTQYLEETDRLADRIAVMDHGRVIAEGTSGELKAMAGSGTVRVRLMDPSRRTEAGQLLSAALGAPIAAEPDPSALTANLAQTEPDPGRRVAEALAALSGRGIAVVEFALGQPTLDEAFLALTGRTTPTTDDETDEGEDAA